VGETGVLLSAIQLRGNGILALLNLTSVVGHEFSVKENPLGKGLTPNELSAKLHVTFKIAGMARNGLEVRIISACRM